ncbi:hypothetical protein X975_14138, partial [Stegodyphus mimosarum]
CVWRDICKHLYKDSWSILHGIYCCFFTGVCYPNLILCISWNTAEPQTTKINKPKSQGPTAYFSSCAF